MRPTQLLKDGTLYWVMRLYDPADGVTLIDADALPTVAVRKNGAGIADVGTVVKRAATIGIYDCSYNPADEVEGDQFTIEESVIIAALPFQNSWEFSVASPLLKVKKYLQLLSRKDAAIATDNAVELAELNATGGSGAGDYASITESLEAIAATTASGVTLVINSTAPELDTVDPAGKLTIHRGDYTTFTLTLGSLVGRTGKKLVFTIKPKKDDLDDDSEAYLQVTEVDGAVLVNGSSTGVTASDASMTVVDQNTGATNFVIKSEITDLLPIGSNFWYDVQMFDAAGQRHTKTEDRVQIDKDVTRRAS